MRILVVEDSDKMSRFLKQGLNEIGYAVDIAQKGIDAEVLVSENEYDLIYWMSCCLIKVVLRHLDTFGVMVFLGLF